MTLEFYAFRSFCHSFLAPSRLNQPRALFTVFRETTERLASFSTLITNPLLEFKTNEGYGETARNFGQRIFPDLNL